jgi:hypothetical protein
MASKQFAHLQESSRQRLRAMIPIGCPLIIASQLEGGFLVTTFDERDSCSGRFQVVAAWIDGYVAAWRRVAQPHG